MRFKKTLYLLSLSACSVFLLSSKTSYAQNSQDGGKFSIGIEGGLSSNSIHTDISNRSSTVLQSNTGWTAGLEIQYHIKDWLSVVVTPQAIQKNHTISRTDTLAGVFEQYNNTYLQLPVMARFSYGRRLQVFGDLGVYLGYWMQAHVKGRVPDIFSVSDSTNPAGQTSEQILLAGFDEKYTFDSRRDARLEFGGMAGIGVQYSLLDRYHVFARASYYYSLTNQQKGSYNGQVPQYNQTFAFTLGAMIDLGH